MLSVDCNCNKSYFFLYKFTLKHTDIIMAQTYQYVHNNYK